MERHVAGNLRLEGVESVVAFRIHFSSVSQKMPEQAAEFSMTNSGIVVINAVYNNGHGESDGRPGPRFTAGDDLFDCSEGCSPLGVSTA